MGFGIADVDDLGLDAIGSAEAEADSVADDSGIADFATDADSSYRDYKLMNAEYTDNNGNTVVHLFVRDSDGTLDHVEVVDHNPSFYIRDEAYDARVDNHYAVSHCETHDDSGERYTTLHGEPLVRVYTHTPDGVGEFREQFDDHYEADVLYTNRFLIDSGIHTGVRIDMAGADYDCYHGDYRVSYDAVEPLSVDATPTRDAKMLAFDIEVGSEDGVPSTDKADWPVTTIVAWDNYTEEYRGWMYAESEAHEDAVDRDETGLDELTIYRDESEMLDAFNQFVRGERPDILTGWFCVPEGEPVQMADGSQKPIENIEAGDNVVGKDGEDVVTTTVKKTAKTGTQSTVEIQTQHGKPLRVSDDHPVLVADDEEPRYIDAGDVSEGQYVLTPKVLPNDGSGGPSTERAYQLGLVAADGSFSEDDGVVFYNKREELHDAFDTENERSEANGALKQRVFTDVPRDEAVSRCTDIGLPLGRKDREEWSLDSVYEWRTEAVEAFLAGVFDGDGHVSNGRIAFSSGNRSARYWIERLCRRVGVWATDDGDMSVHIGTSSVERFAETVGTHVRHSKKSDRLERVEDGASGREETVPPYMDKGDGAGTDVRRIVNDKKRRGINIKRHEVEQLGGDEYEHEDFIFDRVESVEKNGEETCYDIETGTHNFVVNDRVVHNCNDFDIPYLINRCKNLNVYSYRDWSPLGDVYESKYEPVIKGVACVDMLGAYQKTQIHKLDSKTLDAIAEKELDDAKIDVDDGHTEMWRDDPTQFLKYNKVDVELVHRIDDESGATDLLDNLRAVVGCSWTDPIGGNIDMMDILFLRKAQEYGYVLPTAQKPAVGDFHGAYVYTPQAGLHEHVVYPDYSSLYPNMMYQCNISPETLVGTKDDLEQSDYDEDDCVWSYIDTSTQPSEKPDTEADESDMEKVYFLKPSVQEGFIRSVLDDVMGLADSYTGGMYAAVKRVRNSTYGVMGDSDSYNSGFRLFDWRLAEATTLGGQRVLKEGGRQFATWIDDDDAEVVYGDTDSVVTTIPNADDPQAALDMARDAGEQLNEYLDEYAADQFGLESEADARMEIEIETYARAIFFKGENDGRGDEAKKKRYVQATMWDDDDLWDVGGGKDQFELLIKGFEYVRSDVAQVTKDVQEYIFDTIMEHGNTDEAEELVKMYVSDMIRNAINGEMDDGRLGVPFGISQSLDQYGQDGRGMPWYHGAKHANRFIYNGDAISSGDKPLYYYIQEGITGDGVPKTYRADDAAKGDLVDCIAVQSADDVPNGMLIDRPKMVRKTIVDPIEAIVRTLGWGVSWLEQTIDDATPASYYRDSGQSGLEKFEASEAM